MAQEWESAAIKAQGDAYNDAKAKGDIDGMKKARAEAERLRNTAGYTTNDDGSKVTGVYSSTNNINNLNANTSNSLSNTDSYTNYQNQLKEQQKAAALANLSKTYNNTISSLNSEKATITPEYYNKKAQVSANSQVKAKNFAEYLANRGTTNNGSSAQAEIDRNMQTQGDINLLNTQEQAAFDDIARRTTEAKTAYDSDVASANAGIEASALQNLMNQYNINRDYELNKASTESNIASNNASIANTKANTTYQNLVNAGYTSEQAAKMSQAAANLKSTQLSNEAQEIANKYADKIAKGQIDSQVLQNKYQELVNTGYSRQAAADLALTYAQISNTKATTANKISSSKSNGSVNTGIVSDSNIVKKIQTMIDAKTQKSTVENGSVKLYNEPTYTYADIEAYIRNLNITAQEKANLANYFGL